MSPHRLKARIDRLERAVNAEKFFIIDPDKARGLWKLYEYHDGAVPDLRVSEKIKRRAGAIRCPLSYGPAQLMADYGRMQELSWRRHHPLFEKPLSEAEDAEEVQATARYLAYYESPRGQRRERIKELLRKRRSAAEQRELDRLCQYALEDGENWPGRRELLQSKPAFELTPAEILELEALNQQNASYPAERARLRALQELQLQERRKNPNYYKMQVPEPCQACRRSSETI